jgi:Protein of unknown function (DUF3891)
VQGRDHVVYDYDDASLMLVVQIDHSRVAGLLAAHWGNAEFAAPVPYASVVLAAQEHDSGWWNWEIKPTLNAQGFPPDYHGFFTTAPPWTPRRTAASSGNRWTIQCVAHPVQ